MARGKLVALAATLVALVYAPAAHADARACGWILEPTADRENVLFPEVTTRYLAGVVVPPPGGHVEIAGELPYARYMSLSTYGHTLQPIQSIFDEQIVPEPGSSNPYLPGAQRNVLRRSYRIKLVAGRIPADGPAPNTLYNSTADGRRTGFGIAYRIYLPDRGRQPFGGVAPPRLTLVTAQGTRIPLPDCPDLLEPVGQLNLTEAVAALGVGLPLPPLGLLGRREPVWKRYSTVVRAYADDFLDADLPDRLSNGQLAKLAYAATRLFPAGLGENFDNKYVYTSLTPEYGRVVAFRGRIPTTPATYAADATTGTGQLRFWSMCTGNQATFTYGCVVDEQTALRDGREFTVVVSTAADRPANATAECGATWLPWGPLPKPVVVLRNMLPAPDFHQAVQDTTADTNEREVMGPFYPRGTYYASKQAFERLGCAR